MMQQTPVEDFPYQDRYMNELPNFIVTTVEQTIVTVLVIVVSGFLFARYLKKRKKETLDLAMTMLLMGLGFLAATIPFFIVLINPELPIIWGIPVGSDLYFWWTNFSYALITISIIFLFLFMNSLFSDNLPKWISWIFFVLVAIFNVWNFYQGTFVDEESMTFEMGILFLVIGIIPWSIFAGYSYKLYKKVEPSVHRTGILFIMLSALCTVGSYSIFIAGQLGEYTTEGIRAFEFFYWIFFILNAVLLSIGYILPGWFQNWASRRLESRSSA